MTHKALAYTIVVLLTLVLTACDASDTQGISSPQTNQSSAAQVPAPLPTMQSDNPLLLEEKMKSLEMQWAAQAEADGVHIVKTSEEEKNQIRAMIQQEIKYNSVDFTVAPGVQLVDLVAGAIDDGINIPNVPVSADLVKTYIQSFLGALQQGESEALMGWLHGFHWVNHMGGVGVNPYNLKEAGQVLYSIIKAAPTEGVILQNADRFMFVAKLQIGGVTKFWATVISESGAPVTAYDTEVKEVAKYALRVITRQGWTEINASGLPQALKDNWFKGAPPVIRFVWWSVKWQLEMLARAAGLSLEQFLIQNGAVFASTPILGLIVPACILEPPMSQNRCGSSSNGDNKS